VTEQPRPSHHLPDVNNWPSGIPLAHHNEALRPVATLDEDDGGDA
jgi:hypothetical protein